MSFEENLKILLILVSLKKKKEKKLNDAYECCVVRITVADLILKLLLLI